MTIEERVENIERDVEVLRQEVGDLSQRFVEEDPVKD
jgi:hypothetical protein